VVTEAEFALAREASRKRQQHCQLKVVPGLDAQTVTQMHGEGRTVGEIAKALGTSRARIYRALYAAKVMAPRQQSNGPRDVFPFDGLLTDARTGTTYRRVMVRKNNTHSLYPAAAREGHVSGRGSSFPLWVFERGLLALLREVDPREILDGVNGHDKLQTLEAEMANLEAKLARFMVELEAGDSPALFGIVRKLEARKQELSQELQAARQAAAHPLSASWTETQGLLGILDSTPAEAMEATRCRLRAALRRIISSIWILVVPRGDNRLAAIQVWFTGGERHRNYLILYRQARANRPTQWWARSLAEVTSADGLDLRKPEHAQDLAAALAELSLNPGEEQT
jgi:hypothetical protein